MRYTIVHSSTPKAGLLSALAGVIARVPVRLHTFTGQRWETVNGFKRYLLIAIDFIIGRLNSWSYADGPLQLEYLRSTGLVPVSRSSCIGHGSYGGINPDTPSPPNLVEMKSKVRTELGISGNSFVVVFLGRIVKDKGIVELVECCSKWKEEGKDIRVLLVGGTEDDLDPLPSGTADEIVSNQLIYPLGFKNDPVPYLAASNIMCLPSYREGFAVSILQSAALGIPSVGSNIKGIADVIEDGKTGLLHEVGNADDLKSKIEQFYVDNELLTEYGKSARARAINYFSHTSIANRQLRDYQNFISML